MSTQVTSTEDLSKIGDGEAKFWRNVNKRGKNQILMTKLANELQQDWYSRLAKDVPHMDQNGRADIVRWLLGEDLERFEQMNHQQLKIAKQAMDYRYRILQQRYLGVRPTQAYRNLINRLGSLMMLRNRIRTWVALSRDRQRAVTDVIQEMIQEMLNSDRYIQRQIVWIAQCTQDTNISDALLLTSIEEYCLRPVRNQPLLVYRFVNFLRRSQRGGLTHVPQKEMVRMISDEVTLDEEDAPVSLLDAQAVSEYQQEQDGEEQQLLRAKVQQEFEQYLRENVGELETRWLRFYLQGRSQEAIAKALDLPVKQVYRIREKVSYHAIRVFAIKGQTELVTNWLEISLQQHGLGLTPQQWEQYWQDLTPRQQKVLDLLKQGKSPDDIAQELKWKTHKVVGEWSKIYLKAQAFRGSY